MQQTQGNIKVCVRVRPQTAAEEGEREILSVLDDKFVVLDPPAQGDLQRPITRSLTSQFRGPSFLQKKARDVRFTFDQVFDQSSSQSLVFDKTTKNLISQVLSGTNATVFAYGATGAGKTYTMVGTDQSPGVMVLTIQELFAAVAANNDSSIALSVSYLEIYNEAIRDLLTEQSNLSLREENGQVHVAGLSLHSLSTAADLQDLLKHGNSRRTEFATDVNQNSSRSHAVLQIYIKKTTHSGGSSAASSQVAFGKLSLIDLAGSERAIHTRNRGERLREGANINKSLLALGSCIRALIDNKTARVKSHVPYRNSKLTRLLKDSLDGNSCTVMIANVSPSQRAIEDTGNTLQYASMAKNIALSTSASVYSVENHVSQYLQIIADLKREIQWLRSQGCPKCGDVSVASSVENSASYEGSRVASAASVAGALGQLALG